MLLSRLYVIINNKSTCIFCKCFYCSCLALSVIADAMPPLPKGEALAIHEKFPVPPVALPLGELSPQGREGARLPILRRSVVYCFIHS